MKVIIKGIQRMFFKMQWSNNLIKPVGLMLISVSVLFVSAGFTDVTQVINPFLTQEASAEILGKQGLIKGNGVDYNLKGDLKRAEALALIASLKQDNHRIEDAKKRMKQLNFKDVKPSDWYAPYVIYATENKIASGYSNGNFGPNDLVTHRQFLKMIISALGYDSTKEFTWNTVESFAIQKKLANSAVFIAGRDYSQVKLKRGEAFQYLYAAYIQVTPSGAGQKNTSVTISPESLKPIPVKVVCQTNGIGQVKVTFDEAMDEKSVLDVSRYKISLLRGESPIGQQIRTVTYHAASKTATIDFGSGGSTSGFRIDMNGLKTVKGNPAEISADNRFIGCTGIEVSMKKGNLIEVSLSDGIHFAGNLDANSFNLESLDSGVSNGRILGVSKDNEGKKLVLSVSGLETYKGYSLSINAIKDTKGNSVIKNYKSYFTACDTAAPVLQDIQLDGDNAFIASFDSAVDYVSEREKDWFRITNDLGTEIPVNTLEPYGATKIRVVLSRPISGKQITILMNGIRDAFNNEMPSLTKTITISKVSTLQVVDSKLVSSQEIQLFFNQPINPAMAMDTNRYRLIQGSDKILNISQISYDANRHVVQIFLIAPVVGPLPIAVNLEGYTDLEGNVLKESNRQCGVITENSLMDKKAPSLLGVYLVNENTLKVICDEAVDPAMASQTLLYNIQPATGSENLTVTGSQLDNQSKEILLSFSGKIINNMVYIVRINGLRDISGNTHETVQIGEFVGFSADRVQPNVENCLQINSTSFKVVFSEAMEPSTVTNTNAYRFVNPNGGTSNLTVVNATYNPSDNTAVITILEPQIMVTYYLESNILSDLAGNKLMGQGVVVFGKRE